MTLHTVTKGETLTSIGNIYNLSAQYLQRINKLPNPDNLVVGQSLVILYPEIVHQAKVGDTLVSIGKTYGVTFIQLLRNNPFLTYRVLEAGDEIIISFKTEYLGTTEVNGYAYPNIDIEYLRSVLPYLTYLSIFTYGINEDGSLIEVDDQSLVNVARSYGVAPLMHLSTLSADGTFDSGLASLILNSVQLQDILIYNIIITLTEKGYYGLDIDFEFIPPDDRQNYVNFVSKLTTRLNQKDFIVIAALAPKISKTQKGALYEGHDYFGIGNAANISFIMTYEWGYTYGPPMAVAPINKVKEVLDYAVTEIPAEDILMGIPTYGYVWQLPYEKGITKATSISAVKALEIASAKNAEILSDEVAQSPYFYFTDDDGKKSVVYFEDPRSVKAKLNLINDYSLLGCGYWNIDRPFPQNWLILNAMYNIIQVPVVFFR